MRVVIDTNVLLSSLLSRRGASFRLVQRLGSSQFQPVISPPLCLEYEDVLHRPGLLPGYSTQDINDFLDTSWRNASSAGFTFCDGHICPIRKTIPCWNWLWRVARL